MKILVALLIIAVLSLIVYVFLALAFLSARAGVG